MGVGWGIGTVLKGQFSSHGCNRDAVGLQKGYPYAVWGKKFGIGVDLLQLLFHYIIGRQIPSYTKCMFDVFKYSTYFVVRFLFEFGQIAVWNW